MIDDGEFAGGVELMRVVLAGRLVGQEKVSLHTT